MGNSVCHGQTNQSILHFLTAYCAKSVHANALVLMSEVHLGVLYLHKKKYVCNFNTFCFVCQKGERHGQTTLQPWVWGGISQCPNSLKVNVLAGWNLYQKMQKWMGLVPQELGKLFCKNCLSYVPKSERHGQT